MKRLLLAWMGMLLVTGCSSGGSGSSLSATDPSVLQKPGWPDMTVIDNYPNPHGDTCSWDGTSSSGNPETGDKAVEDEHKNRFHLPANPEPMKFSDIIKLPPEGDGPDQERGVSVVAYVRSVAPAGTSGEACNCQEKTRSLCDAHIELVLDPANEDDGHGVIIAETTERTRRLAQLGLLPTNIGNDWSTDVLQSAIAHKWVRFTGWLFFDTDHDREDWQSNPDGNRNWRETCWEVHPVMGIEVLPGKPADAG